MTTIYRHCGRLLLTFAAAPCIMRLFEFQQLPDKAQALLLVQEQLALCFDPQGDAALLYAKVCDANTLLAAIVISSAQPETWQCAAQLQELSGAGIYSLCDLPATLEAERLLAGDKLELGALKLHVRADAQGVLRIELRDAGKGIRVKIQHGTYQILQA